MSDRSSVIGMFAGLVGGAVLLYVGLLISLFVFPISAFFDLPIPIVLAIFTLGATRVMQSRSDRVSTTAWSAFAIAFVLTFIAAAGLWVSMISPYGTLS